MKELKIFVVANPATQNEWAVLRSTKYQNAMDFSWSFTSDLEEANIFIWDGLSNKVSRKSFEKLEKKISTEGHLLLWVRPIDFFESFKTTSGLDLDQIRYVEVFQTGLNPQRMISSLTECKKKLIDV